MTRNTRQVCVMAKSVVVLAASLLGAAPLQAQTALSCAYSHTITMANDPKITRRNQSDKTFELHLQDRKLAPEFCDEVIHSISTKQSYLAFCNSGQHPAKITHDIVVNKHSGEIVTIMTFFADLKWVTKLAQYGMCDMTAKAASQ